MFFEHIYDKSLAQGSYLVGCQATGESIVIDAKRDIDTYLQIAKANKLKITHITETHIHADYLCGSRELASATGAELYLSDEGGPDWNYEFPHHGLKDGSIIKVGNLTLEVLHTPGHTPESISFLLTDHPASDKPLMVFTGDFVFVGDVGRPDLLEKAAGLIGTKEEGAKQMFKSLERFANLPDYIQVWPAHGAGSACGKALGAVSSSTVGYEKIRNWALQFGEDEENFTKTLLEGQPEPPKYFAMMKKLNKVDRPLLVEVPKHKKLSNSEFLEAYKKGVKVIDTRKNTEFVKGHLPNSISIPNGNAMATWAGWVLNYEEDFILIASENEMEDLTRKLMRIGLDNIYGYISEISNLGEELIQTETIDMAEFDQLRKQHGFQILDVRNQTEFDECHIDDAQHIFVGVLQDNLDRLDKDKTLLVHCLSGYRSTLACSILERNGFTQIKNYLGGMQEWNEKKKPLSCVS